MGTAIIVKGANFSENNIGTITFGSLSERVVNRYNSAIGTSEYYEPLLQMVNSLIEENVWDKIVALYPILGDSLNAKCVNLASGGAYPIRLKENATNGDKLISFSNTIEVSANDTSLPTYEGRVFGLGMIVDYVRTVWGNQGSQLCSVGTGQISTALISAGIRGLNIGITGSRNIQTDTTESYPESRHLYSYVNETEEAKLYIDGELNKVNNSASSNTVCKYTGYFGSNSNYAPTSTPGTTIAPNTHVASGEMRFFLFGNLNDGEMVKVTSIVQEFLTAVGK